MSITGTGSAFQALGVKLNELCRKTARSMMMPFRITMAISKVTLCSAANRIHWPLRAAAHVSNVNSATGSSVDVKQQFQAAFKRPQLRSCS